MRRLFALGLVAALVSALTLVANAQQKITFGSGNVAGIEYFRELVAQFNASRSDIEV